MYWSVEAQVGIPMPAKTVSASIGVAASVWGGIDPATYGGFQFTVSANIAPKSSSEATVSITGTGGFAYAVCWMCQEEKLCDTLVFF